MLHEYKKFCTSGLKLLTQFVSSRYSGTLSKAEIRKRKNQLFDEEKRRQHSELGRIQKIEVKYKSAEDEIVMVMNQNISTPYDCARHISESVARMSAIALVDNHIWDMHRPLINNYWQPTDSELRAMSALFVKLTNREIPLERLEVPCSIALDMFQDNPFKSQQIPNIAKSNNNNKITLYRLGDHVDISKGPMVGNNGLIGRVTVSAIHKLTNGPIDGLYRFQGIALPKGVLLNHFAYGILEKRAKKLNTSTWQPQIEDETINIAAPRIKQSTI
ncbi:39S ribosomal protein L39, mitochondrial isoform X2 [Pogonomyrmex barbatus]|uniref:39S ribosomal protein L39, mitochondrial isoform X2 n=1 Tax=Pogonomyrmex barbatus TaxID=144034 RepID=A0A6I9W775_9HYME|nr:39S ribosomal protein L39, mitochondrial isoform X2 [Pogonomyrmex barbatus]